MSTYSPDLRIELITTGDQAGTWGTTTNANLSYVIEQAIAGYVSVSVTTANQAFTYINGGSATAALNQSVHAAIALTTTTTANFAVYAPPASKQYTIYNASSYTATIYNSTVIGNTTAAGTGVAVPAGKTVTVWSDGTNFAFQNNYLASLTLASPATLAAQIGALLHPVGSIYTNASDSTNPATLLGFGTWTAFGAGRVPVGFDSGNALFNSAEETGGSYDATLVSHTHTGTTGNESAGHTHGFSGTTAGVGDHQHVDPLAADGGGPAGPYPYGSSGTQPTPWRAGLTTSNSIAAALTSGAGAHSHGFSGNTDGISNNHQHSFTTASSGTSATNANIQPYITVYMWKRTA